jgi:hypothetical protein
MIGSGTLKKWRPERKALNGDVTEAAAPYQDSGFLLPFIRGNGLTETPFIYKINLNLSA